MNSKLTQILKKSWPHAAIVMLFIAMSVTYFSPVLEGKSLPQGDETHSKGAAQELIEYERQTGEKALWTNSMFGGMPAYQIRSDASSNIFRTWNMWTRVGLPYHTVAILFLYLVGFYVLMLSLGMNKWLSTLGAIAFAFGSYNIIIIAAGHITKAYAIALMPVVVGGVMMIFGGKRLVGGAFTMASLGMQVAYNHVQITYYLALTIAILVIAKLIYALIDKQLADFGKNVAVLIVAVVLASIPNMANLWTTYEYGQYSIRGASELKSEGQQSSGLDKDYALSWSYGVHETPTLLIPNIVGGASGVIGANNKAMSDIDPRVRDEEAYRVSAYWGGRIFTSGPVYAGAIVCFLFFIGCFYYRGREKWWLVAATVVSIMLAWGKNFPLLTDFMFYHFPLYNKFRTVEMALVIASVTIPMLGLLGLREIYNFPERIKYEVGKFFAAIGLTAGVSLLIAATPTTFCAFLSDDEMLQFAQSKAQDTSGIYARFEQGIVAARAQLASADALRSAVFILLASSALWFYSVRKINDKIAIATILVLVCIDLWTVDKRYLSNENFVSKKEAKSTFSASVADKIILSDSEPHRAMAIYTNPFNEVYTSYHHQSVGGYHGAKLRRYQDVIDSYLMNEWKSLSAAVRSQDYELIDETLSHAVGLNLLNTRYLIYNPDASPIVNPYALGAAWFVDDVLHADTPDDALESLAEIDIQRTAIIENADVSATLDSTATIRRTTYAPDRQTYRSSSLIDQLAVFSEIYYPAGWKAFVDGEETTILQADYVLRAVQIPAGEHEIEFRFEPSSFYIGRAVAIAGSVLATIVVLGAIALNIRRKRLAK